VKVGFCAEDDPRTKQWGTLLHRTWTCPATEERRRKLVPAWLLDEVRRAIRADGTMTSANLALYTRALVASPESLVTPTPDGETFEWVKQPADGRTSGTVYVDGSRLDGEWDLAGMCARHGWAMASYGTDGRLEAAAKGRPPTWASGIYGAELWSLLMAARSAGPRAPIRVDCLSVHQGAQRGKQWARAPDRRLARAWGPLVTALGDEPERVVWMPAHCSHEQIGEKKLGNGETLTAMDLEANALVDELAKEAAREGRVPAGQRKAVRRAGERLTAVAKWIGQVTVIAGEFPDPAWQGVGKQNGVRDTEGRACLMASSGEKRARLRTGTKRKRDANAADSPVPTADEQATVAAVSVKRARRTLGSVRSVTPSVVVLHQRRAAASRREAVRTRLAERAQVARWLAANTLAPSAQPLAADRFAALRARARARQAAAETGLGAQLAGAEEGTVAPQAYGK
jgi:hypothetical protein